MAIVHRLLPVSLMALMSLALSCSSRGSSANTSNDIVLDSAGDTRQVDAPCTPQCEGFECGDDGCGGVCGTCDKSAECVAGQCKEICTPQCEGKECGEDGCNGSCGDCAEGFQCQKGQCLETCVPQCEGLQCGEDGCEGSCGNCTEGFECIEGQCRQVCEPQCDGRNCGDDGCNGVCGTCETGTCLEGNCCTPDCHMKNCGEDGCGGSCGVCMGEAVCHEDACCVPTCYQLQCGNDGCGGSCGQCDNDSNCDEGTCVPICTPQCDGKECGDDGCDGVCGECGDGFECIASICEPICVPQCELKNCGPDGCGGVCGECFPGAQCLEEGICGLCAIDCDGKECGDDSCGGICGSCQVGSFCNETAACEHVPPCQDWTCDPLTYASEDGCNCNCGCWDPDCGNLDAPITGCTVGQQCAWPSDCVDTLPEWAILVYLNGDNDLESFALDDMVEMGTVGSSDSVEVIVLLDTFEGEASVRRITQGGSELLEEWGEVDMSNWETLRDFGLWGIAHVPARRYFLVLWDHGEGWRGDRRHSRNVLKSFSSDEHGEMEELSIAKGDYAQALSAITTTLGRKLDIVGFDACLMGMWEVAHATAPYADVLIASQETEPGDGWEYNDFLPPLMAFPDMNPEVLAQNVADTYMAQGDDAATMSVVLLDQIDAVSEAVDTLALEMMANLDLYPLYEGIRSETQGFDPSWFGDETAHRDLYDFAALLSEDGAVPPPLVDAALNVMEAVEASVSYNLFASSYPRAHGLAIHYPSEGQCFEEAYRGEGATWSEATHWDEFLVSFSQANCSGWTCDAAYFGAFDGCDCDCGAWDPDCDSPLQDIYGCEDWETCAPPGICQEIITCEGWTCDVQYYNSHDGCDCGCGCWDPDCDVSGATVYHCDDNQDCAPPGVCVDS